MSEPMVTWTRIVSAVSWLALGALVSGGCALPYNVRTVGRGNTALNLSLGGPLVDNLGAAVPLPAVVASAQHGVSDELDLHGALHLLPAIYRMMGIDLGSTYRLLRERTWIPEVTATLRLSMLASGEAFRIYPELESFASYLLARRWLVYLGLSTLYDLFWDHPGAAVRVHWGPCVGGEVRFARRWAAGLALRWISPGEETDRLAVGWVAPGGQGMFFIQLGLRFALRPWSGEGA